MWLKFGVAKLLCIYIGLTKFEENPEGSSFFCVDLTWNDPTMSHCNWNFNLTALHSITGAVAPQQPMEHASFYLQFQKYRKSHISLGTPKSH